MAAGAAPSFHVHGDYNSGKDEDTVLHLTYGHSKDHRSDLPQAALQLIVDHLCGLQSVEGFKWQ
jgi:transposase